MTNAVHAVEVPPSIVWSRTYAGDGIDKAGAVIQTRDNGYLLVCSEYFAPNNLQTPTGIFYLLKVDSTGNQQWNRTYAGTIFGEEQNVVQTADGGYAVVAGYQNNFLLLKIDPSGNQQWNQSYTETGTCAASIVIQTRDEGYALAGVSNYDYKPSGIHYTAWLVKTDSRGNQQWNLTLGEGEANSLIQTSDGGYALAIDHNFMLVKIDSNGKMEWNQTYGNGDKNKVSSVVQTSDGGYALGGCMWLRTNGGGTNVVILKTDTRGKTQWTQYYGEGAAFTMTNTTDGGFAIAGSKLIKVDAEGNSQWEIDLNGRANSLVQTQDWGYSTAGRAAKQAWLAKIERDSALSSTIPSPTASTSSSPSATDYPTPTAFPSPTIPEFTTLAFLALAVAVCVVAVAVKIRLRLTG
ncbi:MAG: hypothetical protein NWF00_10440 [Candidatus Bathyarchaeota archaeon]|nr:hypothetical protein [Candidatus Bathyarchaeota archaeon]